MREYFAASMHTTSPEARHKICFTYGLVTLQQRGRDNFAVRYGKQVNAGLTYAEACTQLGISLMHQTACDGDLDNG